MFLFSFLTSEPNPFALQALRRQPIREETHIANTSHVAGRKTKKIAKTKTEKTQDPLESSPPPLPHLPPRSRQESSRRPPWRSRSNGVSLDSKSDLLGLEYLRKSAKWRAPPPRSPRFSAWNSDFEGLSIARCYVTPAQPIGADAPCPRTNQIPRPTLR